MNERQPFVREKKKTAPAGLMIGLLLLLVISIAVFAYRAVQASKAPPPPKETTEIVEPDKAIRQDVRQCKELFQEVSQLKRDEDPSFPEKWQEAFAKLDATQKKFEALLDEGNARDPETGAIKDEFSFYNQISQELNILQLDLVKMKPF